MSKLRQDWVDDFRTQEGKTLTYITVTDTVSATTGSKTAESTSTATFTGIIEFRSEDEPLTDGGPFHTGDAYCIVPKSLAARGKDRIQEPSSGTTWVIENVLKRVTHDEAVLSEYTRV